MDEKGNPYAGQYGEWDHWIHANAKLDPEWDYQKEPEENAQLSSMMDSDGFLVPLLELKRRSLQARAVGQKPDFSGYHVVPAAGQADPEMLEQLEKANVNLLADYYPPVPKWLAVKFPDETVADKFFLPPNGDVVVRVADQGIENPCHGSNACSSKPCSSGSTSPSGRHWERYDSHGNLIYSTNSEQWWAAYYLPRNESETELPLANIEVRKDGYALVSRDGVTTVFDYDASMLGTEVPAQRSDLPFALLAISAAEKLREAQSN